MKSLRELFRDLTAERPDTLLIPESAFVSWLMEERKITREEAQKLVDEMQVEE